MSAPCRLRITGIESLNLSAICWASLKRLGDHEVHAHVAVAAAADGCAPPTGRSTAPRRVGGSSSAKMSSNSSRRRRGKPAHVRALAVAVLELRLGLGVGSSSSYVVLLGEAEVDERAVPGVAERHAYVRRTSYRLPRGESSVRSSRSVQPRADAHDRRALLDGDREVLGGAHRQLAQAVLGRQLAQRGEPAAAVLGVARPAAASSSGPTTGDRRSASRKAPSSVGRDAALALLAGDVDLDAGPRSRARESRGARARAAPSRWPTEWISRT